MRDTQVAASADSEHAFYMPSLDGLRFVAFLLIFNLHLGLNYTQRANHLTVFFIDRGWIGVELFFCISSFLFFRLMGEEWQRTGTLDIGKFYLRRLLRLYPLMIAFSTAMMLLFGSRNGRWLDLWAIVFCFDNYAIWSRGFNSIPYTAHLWTMSAEFQLYIVLPFIFLGSRRLGEPRFLACLVAAMLLAVALRYVCVAAAVHLPVVWVTPALHPEATLLGMVAALSASQQLNRHLVALLGGLSGAAFVGIPSFYHHGNRMMWVFPVAGVLCACLVWLAASGQLRSLSAPWIAYLGKISFGLYVFHLLAIELAAKLLSEIGVTVGYLSQFIVAFALCTAMAAASYRFYESPFLRAKTRIEIVKSRPV